MQADRINKQGGLLGYKVEVVSEDDQSDDAVAEEVAGTLIADGVKMVVGHYNSGQSIAASTIYNKGRVIMITPTSSNPALTRQSFPYVFRVNPTDEAQGPQLARFAVQKLAKKRIAIIHDESDYAKGLMTEFSKARASAGRDAGADRSGAKRARVVHRYPAAGAGGPRPIWCLERSTIPRLKWFCSTRRPWE